MSTAPSAAVPGPLRTLDLSGTPRVPFGRLVRVESRKMVDTRGGFWLMLVTGLLLVLTLGLVLLVVGLDSDARIGANGLAGALAIPLSLLLPVFAILSVTSEWSQRTGLVTFSLEPNRVRVIAAKLGAVLLLAATTIVVALVLGLVTTPLAAMVGGYDAQWNLQLDVLAMNLLSQVLFFLMAFGLAMVMLSSPGAIAVVYVVSLLLPFMVYSALWAIFDWARDLIPWIDLSFAIDPFVDGSSDLAGVDWARLVVASTIWVVLPLVLGVRRVLRSEPK